ncbi:MAG: hypothetical protein ACRDBG_04065 [Waterburya sp.]
MEISQTTKDLCLAISTGSYTEENLLFVKHELTELFGFSSALAYCQVLLSCGLIGQVNNLKDVKPENIDIWYKAKNLLIRYLAQYPENASKGCPVYLAMVKARDSVNLI